MALKRFEKSNLSRDVRPWGREVETRVQDLERNSSRNEDDVDNANKAQNSSIELVSRSLVDLDTRVQDAIDSITIDPVQINPGNLPSGVLVPDASKITGGTLGVNVDASNVTAVNGRSTNTFSNSAVSTVITAPRHAIWGRISDGLLGNTSSSIATKTLARDLPEQPDPLKILEFSSKYYHYKDELAIRDDPKNENYDPNLNVQLEWGPIAEELHELGLWQVVIYADHVRPVGVHHSLFGQLAIEATKYVWNEHLKLRSDFDKLASFVGFAPENDRI